MIDNFMSIENYSLLRRLRQMRVLVIHPDDSERHILLAHIKRIGCQTDAVWPAPATLSENIDVVIFLIGAEMKSTFSWMSNCADSARIALISYETPEVLTELERMHVHGVMTKPIRVFGVLASLTTAISVFRHEKRLQKRVNSLDEMLKSRRTIEKAVSILSKSKNISEQDAYKKLREKSMRDKCSIASIAVAIVASDDI